MQNLKTAFLKKKIDRFEMMELAELWKTLYCKGQKMPPLQDLLFNAKTRHFIIPEGIKCPKKQILGRLSVFLKELEKATDKRCISIFTNHLLALLANPSLCHYLPRSQRKPFLIAIGGHSGSGKSRVARECAPFWNALIVRDDIIRKNLAGVSFETALSEDYYTPEWEEKVYYEMRRYARIYLKNGWPVIVEGLFFNQTEREKIKKEAGKNPFCGIWLEAPFGARASRVRKRQKNPSDIKTKEELAKQLVQNIGEMNWHTLMTAQDKSVTVADTRALILKNLR